jgi:holin-like protein
MPAKINPEACAMLTAILCLIGCQLIGETVREVFHLPIPGPVIGMFLLAAILALRGGKADGAIPASLDRAADVLISHMGLLFVPAGVGIIAEAGLLRQQWLSIVAALIGSTVLSIAVTGLVMHWVTRWSDSADKAALSLAEPLGERS